jgi:transposase-like protein
MDETMFGGRRPGKRGWGASGKNIVFGIYQRNLESTYFSHLFQSQKNQDSLYRPIY